QVVLEMNRLGMLVDLSHVNDVTMSDALHTSRAPIIFSHSSARALTDHARDVPDSILKLVPANGGIVMVNFNPGFVSEAVRAYGDSTSAWARALRAAGADSATRADSMRAWDARAPHATLRQVADHIEHIRQVAGVDYVGIGSDFDGITEVPDGLEDVSKFPDLIAELLRRGWTELDVKKVAGLNILRVMRAAERVAAGLQRTARWPFRTGAYSPYCPQPPSSRRWNHEATRAGGDRPGRDGRDPGRGGGGALVPGGRRDRGPAVPDSRAARGRLAAQPVPPTHLPPRLRVHGAPLRRVRGAGRHHGQGERCVRRPQPAAARRGIRTGTP